MDFLGSIIGGIILLSLLAFGIWLFATQPGYILVFGGVVLGGFIVADWVFHIR